MMMMYEDLKKKKDSNPIDKNYQKEKPLEEEEGEVELSYLTHKKVEQPPQQTLKSTSRVNTQQHSLISFSTTLQDEIKVFFSTYVVELIDWETFINKPLCSQSTSLGF